VIELFAEKHSSFVISFGFYDLDLLILPRSHARVCRELYGNLIHDLLYCCRMLEDVFAGPLC
jgi:hypothetical protein